MAKGIFTAIGTLIVVVLILYLAYVVTKYIGTVSYTHLYLDGSSRKIKEEKNFLQLLREQEEEKRNLVIEAKKERTSIDMLKEKKKSEYNFLVQKQEEQFIEEFVSNVKYHE